MLKAFINGRFFTGSEIISDRALLVDSDIIAGFAEPSAIPEDSEVIDCTDCLVTAGLVDLQIAGAGGYLFSSNPVPEALESIVSAILRTGTTAFLLALPTNTEEIYSQAFRTIRESRHPAVLGLHLEGPFISVTKRGAHVRELIRLPSVAEIRSLLDQADGTVKMMTVAPEVCTREVIETLKDYGVIVSAGHSNATYREATAGFAMGIDATTHLFNAMSPMHHRDPGLPGATFYSDTARASIIADGIHVDYSMIAIAKKVMKERLYLVSDAVEENRKGPYQHIMQHDRFILPDGTLSGARLTMLEAAANCVNHAAIELQEALRMASLYPAQLIRAFNRGVIAKGARADLLMMGENLEIRKIFFNGKFISKE